MTNENIVNIQALAVNPAHLSEDTRTHIRSTMIQTDGPDIQAKPGRDDLRHVIRFAKSKNCRLVILDQTAPLIPDLPVFDDENQTNRSQRRPMSKTLQEAYIQSGLIPENFPAAIQVLFKKPKPASANMPGTDAAILTVYNTKELQAKWLEYCQKANIHPESVIELSKLCDM